MRHPEEGTSSQSEAAPAPATVRGRRWKGMRTALAVLFLLGVIGLAIPGHPGIPVEGATHLDWEPESFWRQSPSGPAVHKGIDIAAARGTPAIAATPGLMLYTARFEQGGNAVVILGPKWRVHTYSNLQQVDLEGGYLSRGTVLGAIGTSDDDDKSHLHYSVVTLVPYPWRFSSAPQGWKQMFYLDPSADLASGEPETSDSASGPTPADPAGLRGSDSPSASS